MKLIKLQPNHIKVSDFLQKNGKIAYVSFFVVKKGLEEKRIAQKLYEEAEEISLIKLGCKIVSV